MSLVLEFLSGSLKGETKKFAGNLVRAGRDPQGELVFDYQKDPAVSFNHAVIEGENGRYEMKDLGSTNGTLVNGKKIDRQVLADGDLISFGQAGPQAKVRLPLSAPPSVEGTPGGATKILILDRPKIHLEVVGGPGQGKKLDFEFPSGRVIKLGREKNNDVSFFDPPTPVVSRYHAEISKSGESFLLEDLGSTNGTFLNGKKISGRVSLKNGDRILLGGNGPELAVSLEGPKSFAPPPPSAGKKTGLVIAGGVGIGFLVLAGVLFFFFESDKPEKPAGGSSSSQQAVEELAPSQAEFAYVERRVKELAAALSEDSSKVKPSFVSLVIEQIHHLKQDRRAIEILLEKGKKYLPDMMRALKKRNLPPNLAYLSYIESKFDTLAKSPSGAVGLWQFMIPTARQYKLRVEPARKIDERTNPAKATQAAVEYLDFLIRDRSSAFKAIASYNTGQGSVSRASRKVEDYLAHGDYFYLSQKGLIPAQTRDYVPRFLAAAVISSDPARFGFSP